MKKIIAENFIDEFTSNQTNIDEFRCDYPEGMSVEDLCDNDVVDVIHDHDEFIYASGERMLIIDGENFDTRYGF
jgi:hypothetical protein